MLPVLSDHVLHVLSDHVLHALPDHVLHGSISPTYILVPRWGCCQDKQMLCGRWSGPSSGCTYEEVGMLGRKSLLLNLRPRLAEIKKWMLLSRAHWAAGHHQKDLEEDIQGCCCLQGWERKMENLQTEWCDDRSQRHQDSGCKLCLSGCWWGGPLNIKGACQKTWWPEFDPTLWNKWTYIPTSFFLFHMHLFVHGYILCVCIYVCTTNKIQWNFVSRKTFISFSYAKRCAQLEGGSGD